MFLKLSLFLLPPLSLIGVLAFPPAGARLAALITVASAGVVMNGLLRPKSRLFGRALHHGPPRSRIALTFDDGPHPGDTPAILDALEKAGVRATFFFVGEKARAHPELVRRAVRSGHEVGNHSDTHPWWFSLAGPGRICREVREASRTLEELAGGPLRFFRPPMGHKHVFLERAIAGTGLEMVIWSARSFDTLPRSQEGIRQRVAASAAPGGIVLLHEGVRRGPEAPSRTVAALPSIIRDLRGKGLEPVTLGVLWEGP